MFKVCSVTLIVMLHERVRDSRLREVLFVFAVERGSVRTCHKKDYSSFQGNFITFVLDGRNKII